MGHWAIVPVVGLRPGARQWSSLLERATFQVGLARCLRIVHQARER